MTTKYNTTQLDPKQVFERHVYHRDRFAHYLRWAHVLREVKPHSVILDVGCGNANLLEVLYHNRHTPKHYVGVDVRTRTIQQNVAKFGHLSWASFANLDFCLSPSRHATLRSFAKLHTLTFDFIVCFEVLEHLGKENADQFLANVSTFMNRQRPTKLLISTPCYDGEHVAQNHVINGEVGEFTFDEMKWQLEKLFKVINVWGTFASQRDYYDKLSACERSVWHDLEAYYDSNLISVLFAPLVPACSRNCLWECVLR